MKSKASKKVTVQDLAERRHAIKTKMKTLKAKRVNALEQNDLKKAALLRKRLHGQNRLLRKAAKKAKALPKSE